MNFLALLALLPFAASSFAPLLVASHKLVPGLQSEINESNLKPHNVTSVTNMLKKLITQCSSDAYVIVDQPGLTYEDLTDRNKGNWPFLINYLYMSSTIVGLPRVDSGLDLDFIEDYIISTCDAETINVWHDDDNEVTDYFDVRTRVIKVTLSPITGDRGAHLREHDELIRKILRKLPSPHYTIILTSTDPGMTHPVPGFIMSDRPDNFEIFNDIVNSPKHNGGVEKNDRFHKVKPNWNPARNTNERYITNRKKDEVHLFDYDLWVKNEKLVTTVLVMILSLFMLKTLSVIQSIKQRFTKQRIPMSKKTN
ncbi:BIG1 [Candida margitis]|uniref:BIG1 n=1 Tax=Candida margitis TaxID=1775924 RepID=UPI002227858D|nr:BIG1 [Candida margitis]KAI5954119.1 BIG1 [Candida margitis]